MSGNPASASSSSGTPAPAMPAAPKSSRTGTWVAIVVVIVIIVAILGYGFSAGWFKSTTPAATNFTRGVTCVQPVSGAGSSFVYPEMNTWSFSFASTTNNCIQVNYASVGSGAGITQLTQKVVQFGASDAPLSPTQRAALPAATLTIPETIGGVAIIYNNGLAKGLNLTGDVVAKIYLGTIKAWNDTAIASLNPHTTMPNLAITPIHRSDSSGTSYIVSGFLSAANAQFSTQVGHSTAPNWPAGLGAAAKGSTGVAGLVASTSGAIGYAELNYAAIANLAYASVQNPTGAFVLPTTASVAAAATAVASSLPAGNADWGNVSMLNEPGAGTYPIASFSYVMVYADVGAVFGSGPLGTQSAAQALVSFLWYIVHNGQDASQGLFYVPLPSAVVVLDTTTIASIAYNGAHLTLPG